eukprot:scaffold9191_cov114-Cylindrotheca_fusiformis.AAC.17
MVCSCCCDDAATKKNVKGAPVGEVMNREGISEDKEAVDWWRQKQNSLASDDTPGPLRQTYEISKQPPLHPQNGSILNNVSPGKVSQSPRGQPSFERFAPTVQRSGVLLSLSQDEKDNHGRKEKIISIVSKEEKPLDTYTESLREERSLQMHHINGQSEKKESDIGVLPSEEKKVTDSDPFGCFIGTSLLGPATAEPDTLGPAQGEKTMLDDVDDHLSDVGSDVDPDARDRYLQACKLLKARLVNKGKALAPKERELILSLLNDAEAVEADNESVVSAEQVSVVENAAWWLENNPATAQTNKTDRGIPRNPHTTTRRRSRTTKFSLPSMCGPKSFKDVDTRADLILLAKGNAGFEEPGLIDEYPPAEDGDEAHFDGWSDGESKEFPFQIIGADNERQLHHRVMTPTILDALRGFLPHRVSESNFWLKFSLARDGASLATLLATIRASTYTFIGVETTHGEVFGAFTGTAWRVGSKWFGNGESFLWRLKNSRLGPSKPHEAGDSQNEIEVYPFTGYDNNVQYCTSKTIAVGGGDWYDHDCPFENEPKGIGFMVDGDLAGGETNSCATFANPRLCKKTSLSNEFVIANLEVWSLTPFDNEDDAAQLEMQKLFMEHNARQGLV